MSQKPSFVLVPGAWHRAETWDKVVSLLRDAGYKCGAVTLPSTLSNPEATLLDDIEAVRRAILAETTEGRDVVVVTHSFGNMIGSSAIKGFARPKGPASTGDTSDSTGYVIGLISMATGFNITSATFLSGFGDNPPSLWRNDTENGFCVLVADPKEVFYHDLPSEESTEWVEKLQKQALKPLAEGGEHSYSGWLDVPCWYLATLDDKALPIEAQRYFVQLAKDAGADITVREIETSHSPMLSKPRETADFMLEAVKAFTQNSA